MSELILKDLAEYQECCLRTSKYQQLIYDPTLEAYPADIVRLCVAGLGLAGEVGEVALLLNQERYIKAGDNRECMLEELGDVAYYIAELASTCGITIQNISFQVPWCGSSDYWGKTLSESKYITFSILAAAAGELLDWIKKHVGHCKPFDQNFIRARLGDLLAALATFCSHYGWSLQTVTSHNISKLLLRHPAGYNADFYAKGATP